MTSAEPVLAEESLESRDHAVSYKLVYVCDVSIHESQVVRSRFVDWTAKYKLGLTWLEVDIELVGDGNVQFRAIINVDPIYRNTASAGGGPDFKMGKTDGHRGMLVKVANLVEFPEGIPSEPIPSVVRLKRLDHRYRFGRNTPRPISEQRFMGAIPMDGEGSPTVRGAAAQQGKLPRKLVQARPHIVGPLSDKQGDQVGDGFEFKPNDVDSLFNIVLFRDGNRFVEKKQADFTVESIKVFFRPQGFYAGVG